MNNYKDFTNLLVINLTLFTKQVFSSRRPETRLKRLPNSSSFKAFSTCDFIHPPPSPVPAPATSPPGESPSALANRTETPEEWCENKRQERRKMRTKSDVGLLEGLRYWKCAPKACERATKFFVSF